MLLQRNIDMFSALGVAAKDPRLSLTAKFWLAKLEAPLCLIITRQGALLGESLARRYFAGRHKNPSLALSVPGTLLQSP